MNGYRALAAARNQAARGQTLLGFPTSSEIVGEGSSAIDVLATGGLVAGFVAGYHLFPAHPLLGAFALGHAGWGVLSGDIRYIAQGIGEIVGFNAWEEHPIAGFFLGAVGGSILTPRKAA